MSIIVVSDIHLGSVSSKNEDFTKFLDWLAEIEKKGGESISSGGKAVKLSPPEKLILLGDILELWSPIDNNIKYTVQEAIEPFSKLMNLKCEKVFVLGNHDENVSKYLDEFKLRTDYAVKKYNFGLNKNFTIIDRHYPEDAHDKEKGFLKIGTRKYFFLHGQQFDKLFLAAGPLANIPSKTAEISGAFSNIFPFNGWSIVMLFIVSGAAYLITKNDIIFTISAGSFLLSVPRLFTYFQDKVWAKLKRHVEDRPKYSDVETIIKKKYYDFEKDKTGDDVNFVFGHTHVPEIHEHTFQRNDKELKMLFVNSGSWVVDKDYIHNTFVYIDESGAYLYRWGDGGDVELLSSV
ncbi:UDP-2,3-diacylglucosamine hydrolase [uncultured archaeon]|nr:UDP-2,3-diacylglucosamine hydrolase [uncultured archaeon]